MSGTADVAKYGGRNMGRKRIKSSDASLVDQPVKNRKFPSKIVPEEITVGAGEAFRESVEQQQGSTTKSTHGDESALKAHDGSPQCQTAATESRTQKRSARNSRCQRRKSKENCDAEGPREASRGEGSSVTETSEPGFDNDSETLNCLLLSADPLGARADPLLTRPGTQAGEVVVERTNAEPQVFDNLQRAHKKSHIESSLEELVTEGSAIVKDVGKMKVYMVAQSEFGSIMSEEEHAQTDKELETDLNALQVAAALYQKTVATVAKRDTVRQEVCATKEKLIQMETYHSSESQKIAPGQLQTYKKLHRTLHAEWARRKKVCVDILDVLAEHLGKTLDDLVREAGVEVDEDYIPDDAYTAYT